ncbi:MAG: hypothetical protein MJK04_05630, partial [Psychrosphaera sp.]|nr:hypothetical protein [Psychrosphaera sp.]
AEGPLIKQSNTRRRKMMTPAQIAKVEHLIPQWYQKMAKKGHSAVQYRLGLIYMAGNRVKQHYPSALMWFNLAAANKGTAKSDLKRIDQDSIKLVKLMTSEQKAKAAQLTKQWRQKK